MPSDFNDFFKAAIGKRIDPYPYQSELAEKPWPGIVEIPTGLGKTAGIIIPWLYKRFKKDPDTPRRLIYCLPMRVLVEQTAQNATRWIGNLIQSKLLPQKNMPSVHVLMGGELEDDWDLHPENQAVIIGTQDMVLSRALNRGYAASRFRWPVQFGLINTDCLWVMDEIQLMGSGLATTAQLQAFRNCFGTLLCSHSIWMSATLQKEWLNTVDFAAHVETLHSLSLSAADHEHPEVNLRLHGRKTS